MTHEIVPVKNYVAVWAALIVFTFTTAGVAFLGLALVAAFHPSILGGLHPGVGGMMPPGGM